MRENSDLRRVIGEVFSLLRCYAAYVGGLRLKCDGTLAETRFRLSAKRTSPFKSTGASVQSTTGSRGVRISGSNAGYARFKGSVKSTGHPLHSPVSPSLPLPSVTVCHHMSTGLYLFTDVSGQPIDSVLRGPAVQQERLPTFLNGLSSALQRSSSPRRIILFPSSY
jgi:hypothetical protein